MAKKSPYLLISRGVKLPRYLSDAADRGAVQMDTDFSKLVRAALREYLLKNGIISENDRPY